MLLHGFPGHPVRSGATRYRLLWTPASSNVRSPGRLLLFQFEGIAETWLSKDDWANLRNWGQHPDVDAVDRRTGGLGHSRRR